MIVDQQSQLHDARNDAPGRWRSALAAMDTASTQAFMFATYGPGVVTTGGSGLGWGHRNNRFMDVPQALIPQVRTPIIPPTQGTRANAIAQGNAMRSALIDAYNRFYQSLG